MKQQTIDVHIDRIVLHGFSSANRHEIAMAVEQELTRLFREQGIPSSLMQGGKRPHAQGSRISLGKREKGWSTGMKIAGSVYQAFSNDPHKKP